MQHLGEELIQKAQKIRMLLLDVDGVMTNGQVLLLPDGSEVKLFSIHDGFGIVSAMRSGIRIGIISGRPSEAVRKRCEELQIEDLFMETLDKLPIAKQLSEKYGIAFDEIAFIGDDLPDLPVLKRVGLSAAPHNAHSVVKEHVDFVLKNSGGEGAVREFIDFVLSAQGKLEPILQKFLS